MNQLKKNFVKMLYKQQTFFNSLVIVKMFIQLLK